MKILNSKNKKFDKQIDLLLLKRKNRVKSDIASVIKIIRDIKKNGDKYFIKGIENRIEQVLANLLENSISFSEDNKTIIVELKKNKNNKIQLSVVDEGRGFKEKNTEKIFKRFYSNRPEKFGEHSGLGLNIVKNKKLAK